MLCSPFTDLNPNASASIPSMTTSTNSAHYITTKSPWTDHTFDASPSSPELDGHGNILSEYPSTRFTPEPNDIAVISRGKPDLEPAASALGDPQPSELLLDTGSDSYFSNSLLHTIPPPEHHDASEMTSPFDTQSADYMSFGVDVSMNLTDGDCTLGRPAFSCDSSEPSSNSVPSPTSLNGDSEAPQLPVPAFSSTSLSNLSQTGTMFADPWGASNWFGGMNQSGNWNELSASGRNSSDLFGNLPMSVPLPTLNVPRRHDQEMQKSSATEDFKLFPKLEQDHDLNYLQPYPSVLDLTQDMVFPIHSVFLTTDVKVGPLPPLSKGDGFTGKLSEEFQSHNDSHGRKKRQFDDPEAQGPPTKKLKLEPYDLPDSHSMNVGFSGSDILSRPPPSLFATLENMDTYKPLPLTTTTNRKRKNKSKKSKSSKSTRSPRKKRAKRKYPPRSAPRENLEFKGYFRSPKVHVDENLPDLSGSRNGRHARGFQRGGKRCDASEGITVKNFHDKPPSEHPAYSKIRVWENEKGSKFYDCRCNARKPVQDLQKIKRHVIGHYQSNFQCDVCGKIFKNNHLQLNAHKKFHKKQQNMKTTSPVVTEVFSD